MNMSIKGTCGAVLVSLGVVSIADATLHGRLPLTLGGTDYQAFYDDIQDITWIANANLAASNTFGLSYNTDLGDNPSDIDGSYYTEQILPDGRMTWGAGLHWIDAMNANGLTGYLGYNDWRLPLVIDVGDDGETGRLYYHGVDWGYNLDTANSELANLWYDTLGNNAWYDIDGIEAACTHDEYSPNYCLSNTGPFSNLRGSNYWSGTKYTTGRMAIWVFDALSGNQGNTIKSSNMFAWAVRSGDVSAEPGPAALCKLPPISIAGNCASQVIAHSIADIDAYVASDFGRHINDYGFLTYKNLRLDGTFGQQGVTLTVNSPCRITLNRNAYLVGSDINLHASMGLVADRSADIDASGQVCLISDKRGMFLNGDNVVNANALVMRGNQKAFVGSQSTLKINGPVELFSTGTGNESQVKVGIKTHITADSFTMKADNMARVTSEANVTATGNISIRSGNLASSETLLNARSILQAGRDIALISGGKTDISFNTTVTAGNNLDVSAKTTDGCSVASVTSITYSSKSGNCADKLP